MMLCLVIMGCPNPVSDPLTLTYTVTYDLNEATGGSVPASQTKTQGVSLILAANTGTLIRTGYTFTGWNTAAGGTGTGYAEGGTYTDNASAILFAKWTVLPTYSVTYDSNNATNGSVPAEQTKTQGITLTLAANTGTLIRSGYTFAGWNTASDGSGIDYAEGAIYTINEPICLFAKWTTLPTFTITYAVNDATGGSVPASQTKTHGVSLILAANTGTLIRTGYTFTGWNTAAGGTGTDYAEGGTYTDNASATLFAKWLLIPTYSVTYDSNNATNGSVPAEQTKTQGITLTLAANTGTLIRSGYTFVGWNTASDGSGTDYGTGSMYSNDTAVILYAKWGPLTYSITYFGNGNTAGVVPAAAVDLIAASSVQIADYAAAINSGLEDLKKADNLFAGWNTKQDGSGIVYIPNQTYTVLPLDIELYAQWVQLYQGAPQIDLGPYTNGVQFEENPTPGVIRTVTNIPYYNQYSYYPSDTTLTLYYNFGTGPANYYHKNGAGMYWDNSNRYLALSGYLKAGTRKGDVFGTYQQYEWYVVGTSQSGTNYYITVGASSATRSYVWNGTTYTQTWTLAEFLGLYGFIAYSNGSICIAEKNSNNRYQLAQTAIPSTIVFEDGSTVSTALGALVYTNQVTGVGTGIVTYSSGTPQIATVNAASGEVTFLAAGNTIITAVKAATQTHATVSATYSVTVKAPGSYSTGDIGPSGVGKVFYTIGGGGLEAARITWNAGSVDPLAKWKTEATATAGTSTNIGSGYANTYTSMLGPGHPAAELCRAYKGGGKNDWFLPSRYELEEMYNQRNSIGAFVPNGYWSSSEYESFNAYYQSFANGPYESYKDDLLYVRPIRAF